MKRTLLAAAAISAFAVTSASAADLMAIEPSAQVVSSASAYDWNGFYAGANIGYGWGEIEIAGAPDTNDIDGMLGGVQAGYNYDLGGFVLGVEGDIQLSDVSFSQTVTGTTVDETIQYFGTVRARAGVAFDRFMPYVTGGLAFGGGKFEASGALVGDDEQNHFGWTIGAGLEYAVADNISVKGEYLYTDLGDETYDLGAAGTADVSARFSTVRAGVNFQF